MLFSNSTNESLRNEAVQPTSDVREKFSMLVIGGIGGILIASVSGFVYVRTPVGGHTRLSAP